MQIFIYIFSVMGFLAFLFAQEQEAIRASPCVGYQPNTLIESFWRYPVISMKTDQENWTTDFFFRRKVNGISSSSINTCVRINSSGTHLNIMGFQSHRCDGIQLYTTNWTVHDEVIHLLIDVLETDILLRLLGSDTQVASIPIDVRQFFSVVSSLEIEFMCHKGCPLGYRYNNKDITMTNNPIVIYGLHSPLNLSMNLKMSHDGIKESRNIDLPFPLKNHTLYEVEVKEEANELMITIHGEGKRHQVVEEKMFSLEGTILKVRSDGDFFYTKPDCTFKEQENEDNKNGDDDGDDDDDFTSTTAGDVNDDGVSATTTADDDNDAGDDDGEDLTNTAADNGDDGDGDDGEKPKKNHNNIIVEMTLKMVLNATVTVV